MDKKLILLCGIAASGKSSYADWLVAKSKNYVRICADTVRGELSDNGDESDQNFNRIIFTEILPARVKAALDEDKTPVIDITACDRKTRKQVIGWAQDNNATAECHYFEPNIELARQRNRRRARQVPEHVLDAQTRKWVEPIFEEGFTVLKQLNSNLFTINDLVKVTKIHALNGRPQGLQDNYWVKGYLQSEIRLFESLKILRINNSINPTDEKLGLFTTSKLDAIIKNDHLLVRTENSCYKIESGNNKNFEL